MIICVVLLMLIIIVVLIQFDNDTMHHNRSKCIDENLITQILCRFPKFLNKINHNMINLQVKYRIEKINIMINVSVSFFFYFLYKLIKLFCIKHNKKKCY
jgi:hypothetical protein